MQDVPGWESDSPVQTPAVDVSIGNSQRRAESVSITASVRSGEIAARTGNVTWAPHSVVARRQETVLTPGTPRRGDRITVSSGHGSTLARMLTGKIETTRAEVPGVLSSELMDDWDLLSDEVDIPALMPVMPPATDEAPLIHVGLTALWPTQRALSLAGFYATPPAREGAFMSASLNGSLWPEAGTIRESAAAPTFQGVPWGQAASGFTARYTGLPGSMDTHPLEVSFLVSDTPATANTFVYVRFAGGSIRMSADANRAVRVQMSTGTDVTVVSLSAAEMQGNELARLRVTSAGVWTLTAGDVTKSATRAVPAALRGAPDDVYIQSPAGGRPIGGVNVGYYTTFPRSWERTALLDSPDGALAASRAIVSTPARDVLRERAAAELARMWIDAYGVFHWRSRSRWGTGAPVRTVSDVNLLRYSMSVDYDAVFSGVTVSCILARTEVRALATITLHQGTRQVLNRGDVQHDFIDVPSDEDWPVVDSSMDVLADTGWVPGFNRGRRTWSGAVRVSADGAQDYWATGPESGEYATVSFERIHARKWLHTLSVSPSLPSTQTVETRTVRPDKISTDLGLWTQWGGVPMPLVRGYARVMWLAEKRYGTVLDAPRLPRLEHDCSWWVQGFAVQRLADDLASRYAEPAVTIQGLAIVPDERIEIGDVLTLTDSTYGGLSARVVVTGFTSMFNDGQSSMSLDVEVLETAVSVKTYDRVQAEADAFTYEQFQTLIGNATYQEQENS